MRKNFPHRKRIFIFLASTLFLFSQIAAQNNSDFKFELNKNWMLFSSHKLNMDKSQIASSDFLPEKYYTTNIPKTVLAALVDNGVYKNIYFNKNLKKIHAKQFTYNWWYKKNFYISENLINKFFTLKFNGINYKANIWINGKQIADTNNVEGAFSIFEFDITKLIKQGRNTIAVEIIPPRKGDLSIGFVDWNPTSPDNNMGIWRTVELKVTGAVSISNTFVKSKINLETLQEAELTISSELKNHSDKEKIISVSNKINAIEIKKNIRLKPSEIRIITFTPKEFSQLRVKNPKLWWPNNLGEPNLYTLKTFVEVQNKISDSQIVRFGIREVSDYVNEFGYRGYKINGKPILIKGAGWTDNLLLDDSDEKVIAQIKYAKHLNLNTIRLEGFWGKNQTLYNAADENGILLMIGWSCHWEWTDYCGRPETNYMCITEPAEIEMQAKAYKDQVVWLRNHPSILVWIFGSDKLPSPELEEKLNYYLKKEDGTRPVLLSCKDKDTEGLLNRGKIFDAPKVKMLGPYAYEPPVYWYVDTTFGGAYGFNTETGPGPQIPPLESLKKFLPQDKLWPINDSWKYHLGRNEFNSLDRYNSAFYKRYGNVNGVEEYSVKSQISSYEAMRPMFEAFRVNKPKATGVIQWMFNSAWPKMFWQLFDYYLMPNGAFYSAKKACYPLSPIYNYKDKNIYVVNDYYKNFEDLNLDIKIFNKFSHLVFKTNKKFNIKENVAIKLLDISKYLKNKNLYFLHLKLSDKYHKEISDNFYWLSKNEDTLEFDKSTWFYTPIKSFADLTGINNLPKAEIQYTMLDSTGNTFKIEVKNKTNKIAFFIDIKILSRENNKSILPVFLSDNYFSLLPNESRIITCSFKRMNIPYKIEIKGYNTNKFLRD